MKTNFYTSSIILLLLAVILSGCSTISQHQSSKYPYRPWTNILLEKIGDKTAIDLFREAKSGSQEISSSLKELRLKYINGLETAYNKANKEAKAFFGSIIADADKKSKFDISLSAAGILSGIATGTLIAASPANAVWAAGFTAFSTGVIGYQSKLAQEGYTKAAVHRSYEELSKKYNAANEAFSTAFASLKNQIEASDPTQWNINYVEAEKNLSIIASLNTTGYIPLGHQNDFELNLSKQIITDIIEEKLKDQG